MYLSKGQGKVLRSKIYGMESTNSMESNSQMNRTQPNRGACMHQATLHVITTSCSNWKKGSVNSCKVLVRAICTCARAFFCQHAPPIPGPALFPQLICPSLSPLQFTFSFVAFEKQTKPDLLHGSAHPRDDAVSRVHLQAEPEDGPPSGDYRAVRRRAPVSDSCN